MTAILQRYLPSHVGSPRDSPFLPQRQEPRHRTVVPHDFSVESLTKELAHGLPVGWKTEKSAANKKSVYLYNICAIRVFSVSY